jgi:hypothetical protein
MEKTIEKRIAAATEHMERMRKARQMMAEEVAQLMKHTPEEQLRWTRSKMDLMEALYYVFESGLLHDDMGIATTFAEIVRQCCSVLHVKVPGNPYLMAYRGRLRKGIKNISYMNRYLHLMESQQQNALWNSISNTSI